MKQLNINELKIIWSSQQKNLKKSILTSKNVYLIYKIIVFTMYLYVLCLFKFKQTKRIN